jgi:hypothetical protein
MDKLNLTSDDRPSPHHLARDYRVEVSHHGWMVRWTEPSGREQNSTTFPTQEAACEWASSNLYLCGL